MTCRAKDGGGGKKNKKQVVQPPPAQRDEKVIKKVEKVIKKVEKIPLKPRIQPAKILPKLSAKIPALRHENIYNIPNFLTFSRLLATPVIGYFIVYDQHLYAFSLFFYAAFTDVLDGWLARKYNLQTVVGSVVDPMADKALMTTLVSCMAINGSLPLPLAVLILGRDAALAVAAIYYRYASLPAPKTLKRYWDFSLPSAEVHPTQVSKYNTFLQLVLLGTMMCVGLLHDPVATKSAAGGLLTSVQDLLGGEESVRKMVMGMQYTVAATTVYSGLSYTWTKDAVKILGHDEALKLKQGFRGRMIVGGAFGAVTIIAAGLHLRDRIWNEDEVKEDEKLLFKASK
ncbi:CDP-alcohol phosphatidyltransferase-domain-containing protein [Clohesyomyces aquaticus]|uniref:CDP-alcohol phosphatidyltransferase-domain-containing protein n=1 Tax=Clohesyomyces aquaticus TaxID=1231657 RepID=A0A1Y2A0Q2_9PLEO|nr:CDP-alcohol phosphatidyltransferase-domain-containing protein [Clohesyomyces aquaticus]